MKLILCYRLASTAKDTVFAFLLASIGTLVGTLVAWKVFGHLLGPEGYKVNTYRSFNTNRNKLHLCFHALDWVERVTQITKGIPVALSASVRLRRTHLG